jgi:hypothetical protein
MDTPERRVWGESRLKDRVTLEIILVFTLTCPKTFTRKLGCVIGFTHGYWQWCELRTQLSCWWRMPQYTWAINFHRWSLQRQNAHKIQVLKKSLQARKGNRTLGSWESTYSSQCDAKLLSTKKRSSLYYYFITCLLLEKQGWALGTLYVHMVIIADFSVIVEPWHAAY